MPAPALALAAVLLAPARAGARPFSAVAAAEPGEATGGAPAAPLPATWTAVWENDSWWALLWGLPYADERYTNGLRLVRDQPLAGGDGDGALGRAAQAVARGLRLGTAELVQLSVQQDMYTPYRIWEPTRAPDTHPWAATLTATGGLSARSGARRTSLALTVGAVGPVAQGAPTQRAAHARFGADTPVGWHHQLATEPVLDLTGGVAAVGPLGGALGPVAVQAVPALRASLGTRRLAAGMDGIVALGTTGDLPAARPFPARPDRALLAPPPRGPAALGVAVFGLATLEAVAHDMVLDGGTFAASPAPGAAPLVGEWGAGGMLRLGPVHLWMVHVVAGPEHRAATRDHRYGNASVSVRI